MPGWSAAESPASLPTPGPLEFPAIGRNSFRGPRYGAIDMSIQKTFGLPGMKFVGEGAKIQLRMNLHNAFNKLNLAPFTFGSDSTVISSCCGSAPVANPRIGRLQQRWFGRSHHGIARQVRLLIGSSSREHHRSRTGISQHELCVNHQSWNACSFPSRASSSGAIAFDRRNRDAGFDADFYVGACNPAGCTFASHQLISRLPILTKCSAALSCGRLSEQR